MHHHQFLFISHKYQFLLDCPNLIGDGYCNDETNILDCGYDGGDCCGSCVITDYCTKCECIANITENEIPNALVGNGYCNDVTNNQECNFDGGECCLSDVITDHCTNCTCHLLETCATGVHPSIGDGYCNDDTNIQQCNFDHGDCCFLKVNADYCSNCSCSASGVITSPGFPGNYDTFLDLTWLIQLPLGQVIDITFISLDVVYDSSCL